MHSNPSLHRWRIAISYLFHTSQLPSVSFLALGKDKRYIIISNLMDYLWSRIQKLEQIEITVTFFDYYCFWCEFLMKVYPRILRILVNAFLIWSKQNYSLLPTLSLSVFDSTYDSKADFNSKYKMSLLLLFGIRNKRFHPWWNGFRFHNLSYF